MVWMARIKKLSVISKRLTGDWEVVLCAKWIKQGQGQSPAARQSREWMVLRCCCRWSPFESFQWDKSRTTIEQCRRYHRDFQVCREEFSNRWYRRQQTSPREIRQTCCHRPKHAVCHLSLSVAPSQCCALHGRLTWRSRTDCWKKHRQRVRDRFFFFFFL